MAGFGFSPSDVADFCKFSYRAYTEAKNAPERYASARDLANRLRVILNEIPVGDGQVDETMKGLALHLELANKAYKDLDEYLCHFRGHLDQQARPPVRVNKMVAARVRWTTDQLDKKVDKLLDAVQFAMTLCQIAMISQLSAQSSAEVQALPDTSTANGENAAPADVLQPPKQLCWQGRGGCRCRCHHTSEYPGSIFSWILHGVANPLQTCNMTQCNSRRYMLNLRVALGRFGLSVALIPSLQFIINPDYGIQILPSLQMQRTCNYTSQGFHALYMLEHGHDTFDLEASDEQISARWMTYKQDRLAEIKQLFYEGKISHLDVDPSGATWLEKLLRAPWGVGLIWAQYDLLKYLVLRSKKDIQENPRLLFRIACWIGEGPHLDMLTALIGLGLDPGKLDPALFCQWPAFSNPNWQAEAITPDPFGIDFLRQCLQVEPEFAGCDLLMTHLLTGSDQEFEKAAQHWATNGRTYHTNAFGQSALHLAVILPKRLEKLLELKMSPDASDLRGTTPLMYAAAYGRLDCMLALMKYPSCIGYLDSLKRCFIDYAVVHRHLNLITDLVLCLREQGDSELALILLGRCIRTTFAQSSLWSGSDTLDCLFRLCGGSDIALGSKTSMHLARDVEDAGVVLQNGFAAVDVEDEQGETALMRVSRFLDTRLLIKMLDIKATADVYIDRQDTSGWSVLMHVTTCMNGGSRYQPKEESNLKWASAIGCLNTLLLRGANSTLNDSCSCPCSPNGCSALSIALHRAVESIGVYESSTSIARIPLDFAIALQTCKDSCPQQTTDTVRTFVDFLETGELHTCCARHRVRSDLWPPGSGHATSPNPRTLVRLVTSSGSNPLGGLHFQLARLYDVLQRRSQARHDETLVEKTKRDRVNSGKRPSSGLIVDTIHDRYTHVTVVDVDVPPVLRLDLDAYRDWIAWCVSKQRKMYSRRSLQAWARESSTFVDRVEEELRVLTQS